MERHDMTVLRRTRKDLGPDLQIPYDLSLDYLKFIIRATYDSDSQHAKISVRNNVSYL